MGNDSSRPSGLRELKKRETLNSIELAGVELALQQGHDSVTVSDICERARVSRSTFFNYMPSREAAIFGRPLPDIDQDLAASILAAANGAPLATALLQVVVATLGGIQVNPEVAAKRLQLLREQPEVENRVRGPVLQLFHQLSVFTAAWLERHPERSASASDPTAPALSPAREAAMLTGIAGIAFQDLLTEAGDSGGGEDIELSHEQWAASLSIVAALSATQLATRPLP